MIPRISLHDLVAGIAAAALLPLVLLDTFPRIRGRELLGAFVGILILVLVCGCAPGTLEPLTPAEERRLMAEVMASDICGARSRGTHCHQRAVRWYYKLSKKGAPK